MATFLVVLFILLKPIFAMDAQKWTNLIEEKKDSKGKIAIGEYQMTGNDTLDGTYRMAEKDAIRSLRMNFPIEVEVHSETKTTHLRGLYHHEFQQTLSSESVIQTHGQMMEFAGLTILEKNIDEKKKLVQIALQLDLKIFKEFLLKRNQNLMPAINALKNLRCDSEISLQQFRRGLVNLSLVENNQKIIQSFAPKESFPNLANQNSIERMFNCRKKWSFQLSASTDPSLLNSIHRVLQSENFSINNSNCLNKVHLKVIPYISPLEKVMGVLTKTGYLEIFLEDTSHQKFIFKTETFRINDSNELRLEERIRFRLSDELEKELLKIVHKYY